MTDISKEAVERIAHRILASQPYSPNSETARETLLALSARVAELEEYAKDCTKALTGQTVGGSEFFSGSKLGFYKADIPACEKNIQWRIAQALKLGEAKGKAAQGQMVASVKPLGRCGSDEKLGWKIATSVLEDLEKEVRADGWETCLEVVQIVALSVEQRILSAITLTPHAEAKREGMLEAENERLRDTFEQCKAVLAYTGDADALDIANFIREIIDDADAIRAKAEEIK